MNRDVSLRKTTEAGNPAQHGATRPSTAHDGGERETTAHARAQNVPDDVPHWVPGAMTRLDYYSPEFDTLAADADVLWSTVEDDATLTRSAADEADQAVDDADPATDGTVLIFGWRAEPWTADDFERQAKRLVEDIEERWRDAHFWEGWSLPAADAMPAAHDFLQKLAAIAGKRWVIAYEVDVDIARWLAEAGEDGR